MVVSSSTVADTASAINVLSKTAWKLGSLLSKLDQDTRIVDTAIKNLAGEVKSLSNESDLLHASLDEVVSKSGTGSPLSYDVDERIWNCVIAQVDEISRTMQELEHFLKGLQVGESSFGGRSQRQWKLDRSKNQIASIRTKVCRHTDNLRITLLLINTAPAQLSPSPTDQQHISKLQKFQYMAEKLRRSSEANPQSHSSHTEATLIQCAREVIVKGTSSYEASVATGSATETRGEANSDTRVAQWLRYLESIRRDQYLSDPSGTTSNIPSIFAEDNVKALLPSTTSTQSVQDLEARPTSGEDSEDDLEADLAKAGLEAGTKAFEAQEWVEADSLLQEALRVLQQLPKHQRAFCDVFDLQYKLAVCAYHMQEPADAEEALMSLVQQSANSDDQRVNIYNAAHMLSHMYIRMGQIDRARSICEKALQARRRLLGKQSDAALESTALMAHIYVLLNNRPRAKSYIAMIPEKRRDSVLKNIQESLGEVDQLDSASLRPRSMSEASDLTVDQIQSRFSSTSITLPMETRAYNSVSTMSPRSPAASIRQSYQCLTPKKADWDDQQSVTVTAPPSVEGKSEPQAKEKERASEIYSTHTEVLVAAPFAPSESPEAKETFRGKPLSRKEILEKVGCQPRDRIEEAVCTGDGALFASLLGKKRGFWQSKVRKRGRSERVTALHFAALFGDINMARTLIDSGFNINEAPFGYTTPLTPLKFAIGAREVDMVEFLIKNGAVPSNPDSWSTLAGQLMNRSWLMKTMSEAEKEHVPSRIIAILNILLLNGWDVNAPFEASGRTVLHQAVTFWTGSYRWDLDLRAVVTSFLCERRADPFKANAEGKTSYDMALASGHQDLLLILDQASKPRELEDRPVDRFELAS